MRPLPLLLLIVPVLAITFAVLKRPGRDADSTAVSGYVEARILLKYPTQEIEIVTVGSNPSSSDCDRGTYKLPSICGKNGLTCAVTLVKCSGELAQRYRNMLDKKPASTHYTHISRGRSEVAMVAWGMTVEQSGMICESIKESDEYKGARGTTVTCI